MRKVCCVVAILIGSLSLIIALWPEPDAKSLVLDNSWLAAKTMSRVNLLEFPARARHCRASLLSEGFLYRTWSPVNGASDGILVSPPFQAAPVMAIPITGTTLPTSGSINVYITSSQHRKRLPVFRGGVNVNLAEAIVVADKAWQKGKVRLVIESYNTNENVGVGLPHQVSWMTSWKRSAFGMMPYVAVGLIVLGATGFVGSVSARLLRIDQPPEYVALVSIGLAALVVFFAYAVGPPVRYGMVYAILLAFALVFLIVFFRSTAVDVAGDLKLSGQVWLIGSIVFFFLSNAVYNGLGHWEPNYRFFPATWSSDNELPWIFAEGLRNKWPLESIFGGGWVPTDRPPLMTGIHLMLGDAFTMLQINNDGPWLRGSAYNSAAIVMSALWMPIFYQLLRQSFKLTQHRAALGTLTVALIPFFLFNTIYGWPKMLSAAFAGVAVGCAFSPRNNTLSATITFGLASALSILFHASIALFLVPLAIYFYFAQNRKSVANVIVGALLGVLLLLPWAMYQHYVLPSTNPLLRYALTGDFGFSSPNESLMTAIANVYEKLSFNEWIRIKMQMIVHPLFLSESTRDIFSALPDESFAGVGSLRRWDIYFLSAGNVMLCFLALSALLKPDNLPKRMLAIVGATFTIMIVLCLNPLILHHLPYGAVFLLALAGVGSIGSAPRGVFMMFCLSVAVYYCVVWFFESMISALSIDWTSILGLIAVAAVLTPLFFKRQCHRSAAT